MIRISCLVHLADRKARFVLDASLEIEAGELLAVYGDSGAGKSTLLRAIAGLVPLSRGYVAVNGDIWADTDNGVCRKVQQRSVGFVFQDSALFPHLSVEGNLRYALPRNEPVERVEMVARLVGIDALMGRKPATLSGGQKQRVALARALVRRPALLLLDEPFSSLDAEAREQLQRVVAAVHRELEIPTLLVSHEVAEVRALAGRVARLENGRVVSVGPADRELPGIRGVVESVDGETQRVTIRITTARGATSITPGSVVDIK